MKIGRGLQFNVYDRGEKVEKNPSSKLEIALKLVSWYPYFLIKPIGLIKEINEVIKERRKILEEIPRRKIDYSLLANLKILDNKIIQDKVIILRKIINNRNYNGLIDKYIYFIFDCWKNGFSERTFNFTINNGITRKGKIVCVDFGEITFDKYHVAKLINEKIWRKSWSYDKDLNRKIRTYYDQKVFEFHHALKGVVCVDFWMLKMHSSSA